MGEWGYPGGGGGVFVDQMPPPPFYIFRSIIFCNSDPEPWYPRYPISRFNKQCIARGLPLSNYRFMNLALYELELSKPSFIWTGAIWNLALYELEVSKPSFIWTGAIWNLALSELEVSKPSFIWTGTIWT